MGFIWTMAKSFGAKMLTKLLGGSRVALIVIGLASIGVGAYYAHSAIQSHLEALSAKTEAEKEVKELKSTVLALQEALQARERIEVAAREVAMEQTAKLREQLAQAKGRETVIYRDYGRETNEALCVDTAVPQPIVDSLLNYAKDRNSLH